MCVDRFPGWFTASALPRQDVQTVISAYLRDWVSNYGAPLKCVTDQAKIFLSNDWQELMKFLGTSHSKSSPYHPQANAQTERFNLTVKNALKSQLDAANWAHKLPMVILALRTLYREEFNASAALMLYGRNLRLPNQFYPTSPYWSDNPRAALLRHQQNVSSYQYVPTRFPTNQKVHMNRRLLTCSHVMLSNEHKRHSLDAPWTGPWKVLRRGPKTCTIDWQGKAYTVSVDRLQPGCVLADFTVQPTRCPPSLPACDASRAVCNSRRVTPASPKRSKSPSMDTRSPTLSSACASQNAIKDSSPVTSSPSPDRVHTHTRTCAVRRPSIIIRDSSFPVHFRQFRVSFNVFSQTAIFSMLTSQIFLRRLFENPF